ncbi:SUKH-3 domain-containing protein [Micromonospora sp. DT228]|uniref:SUKH-3 domain-containing protein n=1 Tax=Micromonospora sp. DT228 TaxID=3393443 RepID=UPI003CEF4E3E
MVGRFPPDVERPLRRAGWFLGRRVETARWRAELLGLEMHPAAEAFLSEFGDLVVDVHGPGRTAARVPFELNPSLCVGEEGRFLAWGGKIGRSLYPLGELDQGRFFLGMDDRGVILLVETWVAAFGPGDRGLIALCEGTMPTQLQAGGQIDRYSGP